MIYTGIGSREIPREIGAIMYAAARKLHSQGHKLRSGGAAGSDKAFQSAVEAECVEAWQLNAGMEIYIPWDDFNGMSKDDPGIYLITGHHKRMAEKIAAEVHPAWDRCSRGARALHTRNVFQILGADLKTPSRFVICYAKPKGNEGEVEGGTATAVKIALTRGIPVFNLYHIEHRQRLEAFIK